MKELWLLKHLFKVKRMF